MAPPTQFFLFMCFLFRIMLVFGESDNYIVHMHTTVMPNIYSDHHSWYSTMVDSALASSKADGTPFPSNSKLIYSYHHAIQGFSAHLSPGELEAIRNSPGYVSSVRDMPVKLDTTHSFQFLGLTYKSGAWPASNYGRDVIIGLVDTGIWPESSSFNDSGMSEIPARWKGGCHQAGFQFNGSVCNKKLIGARYFNKGIVAKTPKLILKLNSTRDTNGHGTHISSTAAGNYVKGASFFGYAPGTARGMAPRARIAMYKALWPEGGFESDIIAAIDQAISDGVDVLSISLGTNVKALHLDPVAIATYAAIEKGIFVTTSAGNDGPYGATLHNGTPWVITVAAGDLDRNFGGVITLGNGVQVEGMSIFPGNPLFPRTPMVFMGLCNDTAALSRVRRKIVVCEDNGNMLRHQISYTQTANISCSIFITNGLDIERYLMNPLPAMVLETKAGKVIKDYISGASGKRKPKASVEFKHTVIGGGRPAPRVASYSSRGPSPSCPFVLKPDVLAPGTLILAAWSQNSPTAFLGSKDLYSKYNLVSGTSMSTPHVAGVAALLKAARPKWSPAAIRSAIMTTSYLNDSTGRPIEDLGANHVGTPATPLAMGAGHINPNKALNPGLVYDATMEDYNNLLCGLNYTAKEIQTITRSSSSTTVCSNPTLDLNYPSFMALFDFSKTTTREFHRTLTNVGEDSASYRATVTPVKGYNVTVEPKVLVFKKKFQKLSYKLTIKGPTGGGKVEQVAWGYVTWTDFHGKYEVKSPIVATTDRIESLGPTRKAN
ncbi:hypothetical protein SAY87_003866 [Trapa incisa]|uniref:Subtilisin-like protease SBT1.9 n=1 Tax=Trapa incisa TaxID=236973 RepID=A0AAN7QLJ1_9MYRT|nr:hypothetical protein SAY87_003866 [Trapa incisa]